MIINHKIPISEIIPGSIADELGIEKGDKLVRINGKHIMDILEYKFLISEESIIVEIEKPDKEIWELEIEKGFDEDLGLIFHEFIDKQKSCSNKCIFCFIDQLPKGMRKTLYFKDDDTRLSFLHGNFVTLTNLTDEDLDRIINYRISPINISVHTTDAELRKKMLQNKEAGNIVKQLKRLKEGNIEIKAQIVLCPGINDGNRLDKTIDDLYQFYPQLSCVAIVPVGLTKYRKGLHTILEYEKASASNVIKQVEVMQNYYLKNAGTRFAFLSDEFYLIASTELPTYKSYEEFCQLENGVGITRLFLEGIEKSLNKLDYDSNEIKNATIVTGEYGIPFLMEASRQIMKKYSEIKLDVIGITNEFFGTTIKVSGLITGADMINQLKDKAISHNLLIPDNMLKDGEVLFLDDLEISDIEKKLRARVIICKEDGSDLIKNIMEKC